ncbi:MAG: methyltransferase domain-containing protein [Novosphingobium sp.]
MSQTAPPQAAPPLIFAPQRRLAARRRMAQLQCLSDAASYMGEDAAEDVLDRLDFLRFAPKNALIISSSSSILAKKLEARGVAVTLRDPLSLDEEQPYPDGQFDFIASLFTLDTVNDLPGALIHLRGALAQGGLAMVMMVGAGSLPALRAAMLAADADRPAPRIHPMVDVRAGGQLLQRTGFARPVVDSRTLRVRFGTLARLVDDLRAQGLGNVLVQHGPPLGKAALARAQTAFAAGADDEGRVTETFEILTLSGWRN